MRKIITILLVMLSIVGLSSCLGGVEFELNFVVDSETYDTVSTNGKGIVKMPIEPTKDGYTFDGWYWDNDVWEKPFTANSLLDAPISSNMSVYAKWDCIHTASDWITDSKATCKAEGTKHKECTECEEVLETGSIEKLTTHTPAEAVKENFVDSDCETEGSYNSVVYCSVCEVKLSSEAKVVEKKDHTPSGWIEDTPATCKTEGTKHKECTECEEVLETGSIEKLTTHTPAEAVKENFVDSDCETEGSYNSVVYCSVCEVKLSSEAKVVEKKDHTPSGWIEDTPATCKTEGTKHKECTECEEVLETGSIEKLTTHTPAEAVKENFVDSDCETEGSYNSVVYCSVCEAKISSEAKVVEKKEHTPSEWIEDVAATCKAAGSKHKECIGCKIVLEISTIEKLNTHREGTKQIEIEKGLFCGNSGEYSAILNCIDCGDIISVEKYELPKKHKMSNNVCEICGLPQSSTNGGMTFYLKPDGTYLVSTSSKAIDENIVIGVYNDISVTEINGGAFADRNDITSINIADCVTTIGDLAFYNCTSIKNVIIGNGVREIPNETFFGCTSLRSVTLGDNVETIGYRAFKGCSKLYYVYITGAYDWKLRSERGNTTTVYGTWIAKEDDRQYYGAYYLLEYVAYKWTRK